MRNVICIFLIGLIMKAHGQQPGIFIDSIKCDKDATQTYSLYLPTGFQPSESHKVMLFCDPAARARMPLKNYSGIADQFNLIIACSYNSRNGAFEPAVKAVNSMLSDIRQRYAVDTAGVYLAGFSGGARLATLLAMENEIFAGVIACGASFPSHKKIMSERRIPYVLVIGDTDMNFNETFQSFTYLKQIGNPATRIVFSGGHDWPPAGNFEEAVMWQFLQRGGTQNIKEVYQHAVTNIQSLIAHQQFYQAYLLAEKTTDDLAAHIDVREADSLKEMISEDSKYLKQKKGWDKCMKTEAELRERFYDHYRNLLVDAPHPDTSYRDGDWVGFRQQFNRLHSSKDECKRMSGVRLLDYAWRTPAEDSWRFITFRDFARAHSLAKLWAFFSPENQYAWTTLARTSALQGKTNDALKYIELALKKGVKKHVIIEDESFASIRHLEEFKKIVED
ncbi:MAG TPA: hypothetical protein VD927_16605 [Chryseosolibacter sp.]|nr:hypothetical protein [Chryseosolibacter sp.]